VARIVRIGAVVRLDPSPEREIGFWRADAERGQVDDPEETHRRLAEYERGDWMIVQLDLFVDVLVGDRRLERRNSVAVPGLWFHARHGRANVDHAREMTDQNLERLLDDLRSNGLAAELEELAQAPFELVLDRDLDASPSHGVAGSHSSA
jgi:hypothetical protein